LRDGGRFGSAAKLRQLIIYSVSRHGVG